MLNYIAQDTTQSLWSTKGEPLSIPAALADGEALKQQDYKDAQFVFSRCHHHWHPVDPRTKKRMPIRGCLLKKGSACTANFPRTRRKKLIPKAICAGNYRKHALRVAGRRNALGTLLGKRLCEWFSGTAPAFAVIFRSNTHTHTHTAPNYRVLLVAFTHDPECKAGCLEQQSTKRMMASAQRAQRNTTGYYTGYIQKRQPVCNFELR